MIANNGSPRQPPSNSFTIENILDCENKAKNSTDQLLGQQLQSIKGPFQQSQDKQKEYSDSWTSSNLESTLSGNTSNPFNGSTYNSKQPLFTPFYPLPTSKFV